mmetsp:Transcript_11900/g.24342  ORF Transcript_11900/g.24342 Transcript_11900/m.24342 type:complete len:284 (+) Transcript_11900:231-1082(+)
MHQHFSHLLVVLLLLLISSVCPFFVSPPIVTPFPSPTTLYLSSSSSTSTAYSAQAQLLLKKADLVRIGEETNFGITATKGVRREAEGIIESLVASRPKEDYSLSGCEGKWTLIYTDAPDITSLARTPTSKLGRVGQEVVKSGEDGEFEVRNVIEWLRPAWASRLPLPSRVKGWVIGSEPGSSGAGRVIQKVVTAGKDRDEKGNTVDLKSQIKGAQVYAEGESEGLPLLLQRVKENPIDLKGPLSSLPFGSFEIMYLDEGMRIIKTSNGYWACNLKDDSGSEWF